MGLTRGIQPLVLQWLATASDPSDPSFAKYFLAVTVRETCAEYRSWLRDK